MDQFSFKCNKMMMIFKIWQWLQQIKPKMKQNSQMTHFSSIELPSGFYLLPHQLFFWFLLFLYSAIVDAIEDGENSNMNLVNGNQPHQIILISCSQPKYLINLLILWWSVVFVFNMNAMLLYHVTTVFITNALGNGLTEIETVQIVEKM